MSLFFIIDELSKINSISIFFYLKCLEINFLEYLTFSLITIGNPRCLFLVEIISDGVNPFDLIDLILIDSI
jgi:hypothetical protein